MKTTKLSPDTVTSIQLMVAELKDKKFGRKELVQAVCKTLFFEHGIQPGANTVLQLVQQGSMTDIHKDVRLFWEELRTLSQVPISVGGVPDSVTELFSKQLFEMWTAALKHAQDEYSVRHAEFESKSIQFEAKIHDLNRELSELRAENEELASQVELLNSQSVLLTHEHEQKIMAKSFEIESKCREVEQLQNHRLELQKQIQVRDDKIESLNQEFKNQLQQEAERHASDQEYIKGQWQASLMQVEHERQNLERTRADFALALKSMERQIESQKIVEQQLRDKNANLQIKEVNAKNELLKLNQDLHDLRKTNQLIHAEILAIKAKKTLRIRYKEMYNGRR